MHPSARTHILKRKAKAAHFLPPRYNATGRSTWVRAAEGHGCFEFEHFGDNAAWGVEIHQCFGKYVERVDLTLLLENARTAMRKVKSAFRSQGEQYSTDSWRCHPLSERRSSRKLIENRRNQGNNIKKSSQIAARRDR